MISNSEIILTRLKMSAIIYLGLEHTLTLIPNQLYISQFLLLMLLLNASTDHS